MNLRKGARLGPYEVESYLGAGGMGEVYRARDTRLARNVAIKLLRPAHAADDRLKIRFAREAKAISALSHPNICALYDVGSENGRDYLVMEYCEGVTLAERLTSGPLDVEQALRFGVQIAAALERAHAGGVVHRDVKPGNIIVTRSGVKLLDFGLAAASEEWSASDATHERRITEDGQILGTTMYMAPEVLRGKPADERSDVFALGLVLYEMLAGQRAFEAPDRASLIAKIISEYPRGLSDIRAGVPEPVERVVRDCITKDPDHRIQSAHDVRLRLEWILETVSGVRSLKATVPRRSATAMIATVAAVAAVTVATAWWLMSRRGVTADQPPRIIRSVIDLRGTALLALGRFVPNLGYFSPLVAVSNDGNSIVYVGAAGNTTQLFLRRVDSFAVNAIPDTEGAHHAFFSPDDRWIGFFVRDRVCKVPVAGGSPITIAEVIEPIRGVWRNRDIYVMAAMGIGMLRVPENGGAAEKLADAGPFISDVLPGGRHALLRGTSKSSGDFDPILLLDLKTGERRKLLEPGYDARYVAPGLLTFARGGDLYVVRFDTDSLQSIGEPMILERNVAMDSFWGQAQYSVSASGTTVFIPGGDRAKGRLAWINRDGTSEFLNLPERRYGVFKLSPDGRQVAVEISDVNDSVAIIDLHRQEMKSLRISGDVRRPEWTADGRLVFSYSEQDGRRIIGSADVGGGPVKPILAEPNESHMLITVSLDGRTIVSQRSTPEFRGIHVYRIGSGAPPVVLEGGGVSSVSPDNRWLAYVSRQHARQIFVAPVTAPRDAQQVSIDGGGEPLWCRRCPDLFYRNGSRWYAAKFMFGETLQWEPPRLVWETDFIDTQGRSFDVSPDGKRLLVSKRATPDITDRIHLVQNQQMLLRN